MEITQPISERLPDAKRLRLREDALAETINSALSSMVDLARPIIDEICRDLPIPVQQAPDLLPQPNREVAFGLRIDGKSETGGLKHILKNLGSESLAEEVDRHCVIVINNDYLVPSDIPSIIWGELLPETNSSDLFWHSDGVVSDAGRILILHQGEKSTLRKSETGITTMDDYLDAVCSNGLLVKREALPLFSSTKLNFAEAILQIYDSYRSGTVEYDLIVLLAQAIGQTDVYKPFFDAINTTLLRGYRYETEKSGVYFHEWGEPNTTLLISHKCLHSRRKSNEQGGGLLRGYL